MSKLIGNYTIPGQSDPTNASAAPSETKDPQAGTDFERRAMERLGGSIAFVMKGKHVVWSGDTVAPTPAAPKADA